MNRFPEPDEVIQEVLTSINRAIAGVNTLHPAGILCRGHRESYARPSQEV